MQTVSCNLCGADNAAFLFEGRDILYHTTDKAFCVVRCQKCGLVYLNPQPEAREIPTFYPDTYRPHRERVDAGMFQYKSPANPDKRILDVGCGSGDLLQLITQREKNTAVFGVDIDARAVEAVRRKGFPIVHGSLHDAHYPNAYFDEVYMMNVLEHAQDPATLLYEVARVLKQSGVLTIEVPNFHSISRMIFRNTWYCLDAPRHLYHFTPATLSAMLQRAGFSRNAVISIASPKYFLQSFSFWYWGGRHSYPRIVWYLFTPCARLAAFVGVSSTMRAVARR